jgi:hypothetical protein
MLTATNAAGFPLSKARVYQIRHDENLGFKAAVGGPKKKTRATKKKRKYPRRVTAREAIAAIAPKAQPPSVDAKEQLRRIAMRIGLIRLAELMREIEAEVGM